MNMTEKVQHIKENAESCFHVIVSCFTSIQDS